jgi:hypothetical protein
MRTNSNSPTIVYTAAEKEKEEIKETDGESVYTNNSFTFSEGFPKEKGKSQKAPLLKIRILKIFWEFLTQLSLTIIFSMKVGTYFLKKYIYLVKDDACRIWICQNKLIISYVTFCLFFISVVLYFALSYNFLRITIMRC